MSRYSTFLKTFGTSEEKQRQTGRSTKQIQDAPQGTLYVCTTKAAADHCKKLAGKLDRTDLTISYMQKFFSAKQYETFDIIVFDHEICLFAHHIK